MLTGLYPFPDRRVLRWSDERLRALVLGNARRQYVAPGVYLVWVGIEHSWLYNLDKHRGPMAFNSGRRVGTWHRGVPLYFHPQLPGGNPIARGQDGLAVCPHR